MDYKLIPFLSYLFISVSSTRTRYKNRDCLFQPSSFRTSWVWR